MSIAKLGRHYRVVLAAGAVLAAAGVLQHFGANPAASQTTQLTAWQTDEDPGLDPNAGIWEKAIAVQVPLAAQGAAYAAGGGSVPVLKARALHNKSTLFVLVEWDDSTLDDTTTRVEDFSDAVALEFPAKSATSVPSICMGQADAGVNIWQWRADSQRGFADPGEVYANTLVDFYPSDEDVFYTARAAGNPYAQPDLGPVQTLTSLGFGSIGPAPVQEVKGRGIHQNGRWAVVLSRPFAGGDADQAAFSTGTRTDMAFAVWNGSEGDRNGRKSISQFVTLSISPAQLAGGGGNDTFLLVGAAAILVLISGFGFALALYGTREGPRRA